MTDVDGENGKKTPEVNGDVPKKSTYFDHEKEPSKLTPEEKNRNRKRLLIIIGIVTLLAVVSYVLTSYPGLFENLFKPRNKNTSPTSMYSDRLYSYVFYPSDYDLDVYADDEYMQLDRYIHYKNGNVTVGLDDEELESANNAVRFFAEYFETVIAGDAETYNTYFTDAYYKDYDPYVRFAPQMLYNIEIEQLSETNNADGTTEWTFNVSYMIHRNDGTFRNDIPSDAAKKLFFSLVEDRSGTVKIDYITYYKRGN